MILMLDIGNSRIKGAYTNGSHLLSPLNFPCLDTNSKLPELLTSNVEKCLICSVNEKSLKDVTQLLNSSEIDHMIIKKDHTPKLNTEYDISQMGADRIINVFACTKLYPAPVLIISAGTALTVDFINENGMHQGGMVLPGLSLSHESLASSTCALTTTSRVKPDTLWGKNTEQAINCGFHYPVHIFIEKLRQDYSVKTLVLTGGDSRFLNIDNSIDFPELTLQGLLMLTQS